MSSDSNPQESAQTCLGRRKTGQIQLAKFLSEQEKKIDTDPEEMMYILKNKRESITTLWSNNHYTHPTTLVYGGKGETPGAHWASEMAKLERMIHENERKTSAKLSNNAGPTNNTTNNASVVTGNGYYNNCSFTVAPAAAAAAPSIESVISIVRFFTKNLADSEKDVPELLQEPAAAWETIANLRTQLSNTKGLLASEQRRSAKLRRSLSSEERYSAQLEDDNNRLRRGRRDHACLSRRLFDNRR